jgi:hypothetical protein
MSVQDQEWTAPLLELTPDGEAGLAASDHDRFDAFDRVGRDGALGFVRGVVVHVGVPFCSFGNECADRTNR